MSYRRIAMILIPVILLAGCGGSDREAGGKTSGTNTWMSYETGMQLASDMGKPVVIDFYTSWCRWCKVMDKDTFKDEKVASYLNEHFISIKLNAEQKFGSLKYEGRTYTPAQLTRKFKVSAYPSVAYLDNKGGLIFVDRGFKKPAEFMVNLKYVTSGCYAKGVSIDKFRQNGGKCN